MSIVDAQLTFGPSQPEGRSSTDTEMTWFARLRWMVAATVVVVLVGCGGQSEASLGGFTIYVHDASILPRGGSDAIPGGVLETRDGCVLLDGMPVVWPSGTSIVDEDPVTLELRSGQRLEVGQRVSGAGGTHPAGSESVEVDVDAGCLAGAGPNGDSVIVFNPDEELTVE